MKFFQAFFVAVVACFSLSSVAEVSSSPEGAKLYIVSPENGAVVESPVVVRFGLTGMGVAPAGVDKANTGHHHLLINKDELPEMGKPMGSDVKHFGGGQTETTVELAPGEHTLQLILGNHLHIPHDPVVISDKIAITVK
jgi:hypothetical protein